ncbi:MAG TPA: RidA family protein [Roseiarcus sp.]|jgi:enamine deaminase RidA (YjgF/YER057c/UK114 family)
MHQIIHPDGCKPARGYANGVLAEGARLYVAGQIGWNKDQAFERRDFVGQLEQALANVVAVVETAKGRREDIVRMTWYVIDKNDYLSKRKEVGGACRRIMGRHFPAMTMMVVAGLLEETALIEIEATAVLPTAGGRT